MSSRDCAPTAAADLVTMPESSSFTHRRPPPTTGLHGRDRHLWAELVRHRVRPRWASGRAVIMLYMLNPTRESRSESLQVSIGIAGVIVAVVGVVVTVISGIVAHIDSTTGWAVENVANDDVPVETNLPVPQRTDGPSMDAYCGSLGFAPHAWLPGQKSQSSLEGRIVNAEDAAFTWSCTQNGEKLTRDDITAACQLLFPRRQATTWNRDNAYSWVCR